MNTKKIEELIKELLLEVGEDPARDGLAETPARVARYFTEVLAGYQLNFKEVMKTFPNDGGEHMVIVKDIQFYSLCEHHLVPFFGTVSISYIPTKQIAGLSKFVRLVEVFSKRLQVQERLTKQILDAVEDALSPKGIAIRVQAKHLCMSMRGVRNEHSVTVTTAYSGVFKECSNMRQEFLDQL